MTSRLEEIHAAIAANGTIATASEDHEIVVAADDVGDDGRRSPVAGDFHDVKGERVKQFGIFAIKSENRPDRKESG